MSEAPESATPPTLRSKYKPAAVTSATPKFELPNFELPKMEIPAAFRELAEKSVSQAKETYEKMKLAAEEATDVLEGAARGGLQITSLAEESRPPAHASDEAH